MGPMNKTPHNRIEAILGDWKPASLFLEKRGILEEVISVYASEKLKVGRFVFSVCHYVRKDVQQRPFIFKITCI